MNKSNIRPGMINRKLNNFLALQLELYENFVDETANTTYFTPKFNQETIDFIRKIIVNTEIGNLHSEVD